MSPRASSSSSVWARVSCARASSPPGSSSSIPHLEAEVHHSRHHRLDRAVDAATSETVTSCGRTSLPPKRADRAEEAHHEVGRRLVVDLPRRADLLDLAVVHHRDPVGDLHRLLLIVGDEHGGHALLVVQAAQPLPQLRADVRVERAERLVEQQHLRLDRQRARERHPLALTARQLVRALLRPRSSGRPAPAARRPARGSRPSDACGSAGRRRRSRGRSCARTRRSAGRRSRCPRSCGRASVTSSPSIRIAPVSGASSPAMIRSSVDLPEPLGPSSAVSDPSGTSSVTSSSAVKSPKRLDDRR